jgi:signal peptidase I
MPEREGFKETIESIVVALILAFVFRAFVVEAFVIPTGSMAPTLYGAHGTIICEDCGVEFAYGLRDLGDTRKIVPVRASARAFCPNCNHANSNLKANDDSQNAEKGDRILVLKWPFDIGGKWLSPARWDVTVFKDPSDGVTNFIKRLAGLPNEVLMIVDGDVYTVPVGELSSDTVEALDAVRHEKFELREGILKQPRLSDVPNDVLEELDEKMAIARKTPEAQQPLWFLVYDNDLPPQTADGHQPTWIPSRGASSGWNASGRRFTFEDQAVPDDYIELAGKEIRAGNAYNIHQHGYRAPPVSDLRVRFVLTPQSDDSAVRVRLEKLGRAFVAEVRADGVVTLTEDRDGKMASPRVMASTRLQPIAPGTSVQVSFENVDYRLALTVGGKEVLASSDDPESSAYYGPDLKTLRRLTPRPGDPPRVYGEGTRFELSHLVVERDIYYYHNPALRALSLRWAPRHGWASPSSPILLRSHEYFMLGDNTSASKDSRLWDVAGEHLLARGEDFQLGTVPEDQLIGKAFFVYWPSGYRLTWLPIPVFNRMGIIPDVGRMRWIR